MQRNHTIKRKQVFEKLQQATFPYLFVPLIFIGIFFSNTLLNAQTTISGRITTNSGQPVASASVTLSDSLNGNILAFAISNAKGDYKIELASTLKVAVLQVRAFNYAFESRPIPNQTAEYNFTLTPKPTELPNVVVNPSPIRQKGDTLNYVVSAFADQKDRSIADVLSKMPGIEVQADGRVMYQGKAIQKYYIEGMDLLEGKYNLANNNLPHKSVSSVQILENHQPIRILDSLVPTDRASLNIKLKNNITVTGSGRAGIGAEPFLWDAAMTPMLFKKQTQFIGSWQTNNTGNDVSRQLKTLTIENLMDQLDAQPAAASFLQVTEAAVPPVGSNRYLDNNVHLLTGNLLTKINKDLEIRVNASYLNDVQNRQGDATTLFYTPSGEVALVENIRNRYFVNELETRLTVQQNTPKGYFKNMLTLNLHDNQTAGILFNGTDSIAQRLTRPMQQVNNQLRWITPIGKQLITIYSNIQYNQMPDVLQVTPGPFASLLHGNEAYPELRQSVSQTHFNTHHYLEGTKGWRKWTFTPRAGIQTMHQQLESEAETGKPVSPENAQNNRNANTTKAYMQANAIFKAKGLELTFNLPFSSHHFYLNDMLKDSSNRQSFLTFDPGMYANIIFNAYWRLTGGGGYQNSFSNFNQIFNGLIVENYRSIRINNLPIAQTRAAYGSLGLFYRDPIKAIFTHIDYRYQYARQPYLPVNRINPDGSREMVALLQPNDVGSHTLNYKFSKYVTDLKTTFGAGLQAGISQSKQVLDGTLTRSINRYLRPNIKMNTRLGGYMAWDYELNFNMARNALKGQPTNKLFFLSQSLQLHIYPAKNQYIGLAGEHYYNKALNQKTNIFYPDLTYRYTFTKKRIDLQLTATNLLNERTYISTRFTDFYFYQSIFQIRPRQVVASVKFQF